ncbi:MAG: hypothetical protein JO301_17040 [Chitinophagaceae bacterium]|nr:hypothetical protein [Chitinophagaceae bacterium]
MWQKALAVLLEAYAPCTAFVDSTHQFTTGDIAAMLSAHTGESIDQAELAKTLESRGFSYVRTGDLTLEWLMRQQ